MSNTARARKISGSLLSALPGPWCPDRGFHPKQDARRGDKPGQDWPGHWLVKEKAKYPGNEWLRGNKISLILAGCWGKAGGARLVLWHFSSLASRRSSTGTIPSQRKGKWKFSCATLGLNLQCFCLVFCGRFLDCSFRPNLIPVPGKEGCLLISESGVIPLGETERISPFVEGRGFFGMPVESSLFLVY